VDNYWIRTVANGGTSGFDNGINSAILRYVGAADADPTTNASTSTAALVETDLHPLVPTAVPGTAVAGGADVAMNLAITLDFTTFTFDINGNVRALNFFAPRLFPDVSCSPTPLPRPQYFCRSSAGLKRLPIFSPLAMSLPSLQTV
jgi:hypothetical protein